MDSDPADDGDRVGGDRLRRYRSKNRADSSADNPDRCRREGNRPADLGADSPGDTVPDSGAGQHTGAGSDAAAGRTAIVAGRTAAAAIGATTGGRRYDATNDDQQHARHGRVGG